MCLIILLLYGCFTKHHKEQNVGVKTPPSPILRGRVPTFCSPLFRANCFIMGFLKLLCSLGINFALIFTNRTTFTMYRGAVSVRLLFGDCRRVLLCGWKHYTIWEKGCCTVDSDTCLEPWGRAEKLFLGWHQDSLACGSSDKGVHTNLEIWA